MLYKYQPLNTQNIQSLIQDQLWYSSPDQFNDPLDCKPSIEIDSTQIELIEGLKKLISDPIEFKRKIYELRYKSTNPDHKDQNEAFLWYLSEELKKTLTSHYSRGVCCFSKNYENHLMWSHYAGQHKGICIGYSNNRDPLPETFDVIYCNDRAIKTSLIIDALSNTDKKAINELEKKLLLTKTKHWEYEEEVRLLSETGLQTSNLKMEEVYFGLRCPGALKYCLYSSLYKEGRNLKFFYMTLNQNTDCMERNELEVDEMNFYYPRVAESFDNMFDVISTFGK